MDALDQAVRKERAFIGACADVPALLDRMAEYRDLRRQAVARGSIEQRLRMDDLLELAETRISTIKARVLQVQQSRVPRASPPSVPAVMPSVDAEEAVPRATPLVVDPRVAANERLAAAEAAQKRAEQRRQEARQREEETRRLARDLDEVEARIHAAKEAWRRAKPEREASLQRAAQHEAALRARREELARLEQEAPAVAPPTRRGAKASVLGTAIDSGVLTGTDLVRFRQSRGLTQREAAANLGVAHGTVGKAEAAPGRPLGPMLGEALRAASGG